jgi:hypothetical protein
LEVGVQPLIWFASRHRGRRQSLLYVTAAAVTAADGRVPTPPERRPSVLDLAPPARYPAGLARAARHGGRSRQAAAGSRTPPGASGGGPRSWLWSRAWSRLPMSYRKRRGRTGHDGTTIRIRVAGQRCRPDTHQHPGSGYGVGSGPQGRVRFPPGAPPSELRWPDSATPLCIRWARSGRSSGDPYLTR